MSTDEIEINRELQQILWVCYENWQTNTSLEHERRICFSGIIGTYERRFGARFHQSKLQRLATLGFLEKEHTTRGGNRRYYSIVDPAQVSKLLKSWGLI